MLFRKFDIKNGAPVKVFDRKTQVLISNKVPELKHAGANSFCVKPNHNRKNSASGEALFSHSLMMNLGTRDDGFSTPGSCVECSHAQGRNL